MKKTLIPIALAFALIAVAPAAFAAAAPRTRLNLSATVINNCSITTTPIGFGNYDPLRRCRNNASGTRRDRVHEERRPDDHARERQQLRVRQMKDAGATNYMNYEIYQPPTNAAGAACTWVSPVRWGTTAGAEIFTPSRCARQGRADLQRVRSDRGRPGPRRCHLHRHRRRDRQLLIS